MVIRHERCGEYIDPNLTNKITNLTMTIWHSSRFKGMLLLSKGHTTPSSRTSGSVKPISNCHRPEPRCPGVVDGTLDGRRGTGINSHWRNPFMTAIQENMTRILARAKHGYRYPFLLAKDEALLTDYPTEPPRPAMWLAGITLHRDL